MAPNLRKRSPPSGDQHIYSNVSKSSRISEPWIRNIRPEDCRMRASSSNTVVRPGSSQQQPQPQDHGIAYRQRDFLVSIAPALQDSNSRALEPLLHSGRQPCEAAPKPPPSTAGHKPLVLHRPHPDSKLCQNFHWVPYPLGLMPYDSWHKLHHREGTQPPLSFRCAVCRQERKVTAHLRKLFLVAERLTWDDKLVSAREKDMNEELNWAVNYELGILDPCIEDPEQVIGGKKSRGNKFYPYQNECEMKLALKFMFMTQDMTETTWALWIGTQMHLQDLFDDEERDNLQSVSGKSSLPQRRREASSTTFAQQQIPEAIDTIDLTESPEPASKVLDHKSYGLRTPPSSLPNAAHGSLKSQTIKLETAQSEEITTSSPAPPPATGNPIPPKRIQSYKSLQDFYSLLDKIERTSYVGALFLEAYAEKLRDDMCKDCWLKHNINLDVF